LKVVDERITRFHGGATAIATAALLRDFALLCDVAFLHDMALLCDMALLRCTTATLRGATTVAAEDLIQYRIDPVQESRQDTRKAYRAASATTALTGSAAFLRNATFLNDFTLLVHVFFLDDRALLHDVAPLLRRATT
jgi:hypothetical protein